MANESSSRNDEAFLCRGEGLTMRCPSQCVPCERLSRTVETVDVHKLGVRFNFTDGSWEVMDQGEAVEHLWKVVSMLQIKISALSETAAIAPAEAYVLAIQQSVGSILSQYAANKILDRAKEIANGN
jgi:hypothetical protein